MSRKLSRLLSALIAAVLVVSFLPFKSLVKADTGNVYYIYSYLQNHDDFVLDKDKIESASVDGLGTSVPEGATQLGVYIDGGSYIASPNDRIIFINNATVNVSNNTYFNSLNEDMAMWGLSGKSKLITDTAVITDDYDRYDGEINYDDLFFHYLNTRYNYEITSDIVYKGYLQADNVIIDKGATFSIVNQHRNNYMGEEFEDGSSIFAYYDLRIKGKLVLGEMSPVVSGTNSIAVEEGSIIVENGGEIIPANGAHVFLSENANQSQGIELYRRNSNQDYEIVKSGGAYYCAEEGKWFTNYRVGFFDVGFNDYTYIDEKYRPQAAVDVNGQRIRPYDYLRFNANEQITFNLYPSKVTKEIKPVVIIHYENNDVYPEVTKTDSGYVCSYTPTDNVGFRVQVSWCEFDRVEPTEDQFRFAVDAGCTVTYTVSPSGESYTDPASAKSKVFLFDKSVLDNGDVTITFNIANGFGFESLYFLGDYYTSAEEALENSQYITKVSDSVYKLTINKDNYDQGDYISLYSNDGVGDLFDRNFKVMTELWNDYYTDIPEASVIVNGETQQSDEKVYDFEINKPINIQITPPKERQVIGTAPIVQILQGTRIFSSSATGADKINLSAVSGKDFTYSFSFTPTSEEGFAIKIYWSEYDSIQQRSGDILFELSTDERNAYTLINQPDMAATKPGNVNSARYLFTRNNIPQNGIKIKLESDELRIRDVYDVYSDTYFVPDNESIDEGENKIHFSDSELFSFIDGYLYLTVPSDSEYYRFDFYYHDYDEPFGVGEGQYKVLYDEKYDGDTLEGYVEVNGSIVEADEFRDFEVGEELVFTLHSPENRKGLTRIVRIFDEDTFIYSNESNIDPEHKIEVINDEFKFTPTSTNGFKVVIVWCDYDEIWPYADGSNIWVQTHAYDNGSITTSGYYFEGEDPSDNKDHKYLFSTSLLDGDGYIKFSFVPYANNDVACVTIDGVQYVESHNDCYPDAQFMSSNPNFVKEDGIWTYRITDFDKDHIHYYIDCAFTCEELPSQVVATSIALNDRIGINYYLDLPDEVANDENAYAQVNNVRYEIGAKNSDGLYPVRASVAVAEMNDELHLWICNGEGGVYTLCDKDGNDVTANGYTYSVAAYIAEAKASGNDQKLMLLLDRTNDFGKSAQDHFGYNTDLGTFSYSASDISGVASSDLNRYKSSVVVNNPDAGISSAGSSLALDTATVIRHYFKLAPGKTINDFKFTVNADPVKTTSTGKYTLKYNSSTSEVVLSINGIAAAELQNSYRVSVSDTANHITALEISNFSALSYAYTVLSKAEADASYNSRYSNLVTLMKAMYLYNRAAMQYFKVEEQDPVDDGPHDVAVGGVGDVSPEEAGVGEGSVPPEEGTAAVTDSASAVTIPTSGTPGSGVAGVRTGEEEDASDAEQTPGQDAAPAGAVNVNQEDSDDPAETEPVSPCMDDELAGSEADPGSSSSAGEQPKEESAGAVTSGEETASEGTTAEGTSSGGTSSGGTSASVEKVGN